MPRSPVQEMIASHLGGGSDSEPTGGVESAPVDAAADMAADPVEEAMGEMSSALTSGDAQGAAMAFRKAFRAMELEPHLEAGEGEG